VKIHIDVGDVRPVYEQIVSQIESAVKSGALPPSTRLPAIRQLARDLEINQNTVAKAYQILESHRIVRTLGPRGTVVNEGGKQHVNKKAEKTAIENLSELVSLLRSNGMSAAEIKRAFNAAIKTSF